MNTVTEKNINSILLAGEGNKVEFKTRAKSAVKALPKIISAFANTDGGIIIFGYDERKQLVTGASHEEFEIVKNTIKKNKLEDICNTYTIQHEEKILIITQVEKSKSIVIAGGGAYIRNKDNISILTSQDVMKQIGSSVENSESVSSKEDIERLERKIGQIYDELLRSKKAHDEEIRNSKRNNWFFCILSAFIGYALSELLQWISFLL